jgi:hypothetical protein
VIDNTLQDNTETEYRSSRNQQRDHRTQHSTAVGAQKAKQLLQYAKIAAGWTLFGDWILFTSGHIAEFQVRPFVTAFRSGLCGIVRRQKGLFRIAGVATSPFCSIGENRLFLLPARDAVLIPDLPVLDSDEL